MMKNYIFILSVSIFGWTLNVQAQDIHYSQFWMNNIQYNSSLAGGIEGPARASVSYRKQWFSSVPYTTYSASVDTKINPSKNGALGVGMYFYKDVAGDSRFSNSEGKLVVSSLLNIADRQKLSIGVGGGFIQKNFERLNGSWNSQYIKGKFNPNSPSFEPYTTDNTFKGDLSVGATYFYGLGDGALAKAEPIQLTFGVSVNHILSPSMENYIFNEDRLYRNLVVHGEAQVALADGKSTIIPGYFMQFQGPSSEIVLGSQYRYALNNSSEESQSVKKAFLNFGTHLRYKDALITSVGLLYDNYQVGISYDWNVNPDKRVSQTNGAFEINLLYRMPAKLSNVSYE